MPFALTPYQLCSAFAQKAPGVTVPAWVWAGAGALVGALVGGLVGGLVGAFVRGAGVLAGALVGAFAVVAGVGGAPTAALGVPSGSIDAAGYVEISAGDEAGTADEVPAVPDPPIAAGIDLGIQAERNRVEGAAAAHFREMIHMLSQGRAATGRVGVIGECQHRFAQRDER